MTDSNETFKPDSSSDGEQKVGKGRLCLLLFLTFLKIGAFTFGGGYAMIPIIQREAADRRKWITAEELLDIVAVSESTPGPIAINSATFVGYRKAGVLGALCATFGTVLPSFVIILLISYFLRQFSEIDAVRWAFTGIRAGVTALIVSAVVKMARTCPQNAFSYIIAALAFCAVVILDANVLLVIVSAAIVGIAWSFTTGQKHPKRKKEADK